jgi:hypothetical protein
MIDGVETRTCSKCGRELPLASFYAHKRGLQGRRPDCKSCHNTYRNGWARRRYVPKTGRRYVTKADRAAQVGREALRGPCG